MALKVANWGYVLESRRLCSAGSCDAVERRTHPRRLSREQTSHGIDMTSAHCLRSADRMGDVPARRQRAP